jgi:hypothetical protein
VDFAAVVALFVLLWLALDWFDRKASPPFGRYWPWNQR